jgi:glycerol transport system ATP-binding protein
LPASVTSGTALTVGIRAAALRVKPRPGDVMLSGRVDLAEISGSDTFVHVHTAVGEVVLQLGGVHTFTLGEAITLQLGAAQFYVFDGNGDLLVAPDSELKRAH